MIEHFSDEADSIRSAVVVETAIFMILGEGVSLLARHVLMSRRHFFPQRHHFVEVLNVLFHVELVSHIDDILVLLW